MQKIKVGINGFGRIGRITFRIILERDDMEVVAINDLLTIDQLAYLLKYDSVHGKLNDEISTRNNNLVVNGKEIRVITDQFLSQGINSFNWDSKNSRGQNVPAGVYFYQAKANSIIQSNNKQTHTRRFFCKEAYRREKRRVRKFFPLTAQKETSRKSFPIKKATSVFHSYYTTLPAASSTSALGLPALMTHEKFVAGF